MMGVPRDHTTPYVKLNECHECGEKFKKNETMKSGSVIKLEIYDDPWAVKPCTVKVHDENDTDGHGSCSSKLFDTSWADFRYFECYFCHRVLVRQCLDKGWRSFVKHWGDEEICVKCYQDDMLESGVAGESLLDGKLPGDFFNNSDLNASGWSLVPGMNGRFIDSKESSGSIIKAALGLIQKGYKVLVNYDSMGIGGGEGYVSLYCKKGGE